MSVFHNNSSTLKSVFVIILLLGAISCSQDGIVLEKYHSITDKKWHIDSIKHYNFTVNDTASEYIIFIQTANTNDYSYSNIWFFTRLISQQNHQITDTLEFDLAKPTGKWLGTKKKEQYLLRHVYRHGVKFAQSGNYKFSIQHGMRTTELNGISEVGLVIKKIKKLNEQN